MFATNARYKREAYRGSEFAARILADNGIPVVMKSDHPVLNSRHLLFEAQQAHFYGLSANHALASVMSTPARIMGMDHRIGYLKEGYDADVVIWDSHPLSLGATPKQVFIDGIPQLKDSYVSNKPRFLQNEPKTPNFDKEAAEAVEHEGLQPLEPHKTSSGPVVFVNVASIILRDDSASLVDPANFRVSEGLGVLVASGGKVVCYGMKESCTSYVVDPSAVIVDLKGGSISPSLLSFGSPLGLEEIRGEASTQDGLAVDTLSKSSPLALQNTLIRASDGLQFATRHA